MAHFRLLLNVIEANIMYLIDFSVYASVLWCKVVQAPNHNLHCVFRLESRGSDSGYLTDYEND